LRNCIQNHASSYGLEGLDWATSSSNKNSLERKFDEDEIKEAAFHLDGEKAPGPDDFCMAALQHGCDIIKEDLMAVFREFHKFSI
jgi:hypothetical protein